MSNQSLNSNVGIIIPSSFEMECFDTKRFATKPTIVRSPGMGKVNVALEVADMSEYCNKIILGGFCGGLRGLAIGEVISPQVIYEGDYDARPLEQSLRLIVCKERHITQIREVPFVSQDRFLSEDPYTNRIGLELVSPLATDMESYAFVKACLKFGVEPYVIKVVSDLVDGDASKDFLKSCERLKEKMNIAIDLVLCEALSKRR